MSKSKARRFADLLDANGDIDSGALDNVSSVSESISSFPTNTSFEGTDLIPVYNVSASQWEKATITNAALVGPAGADGADGADGAAGASGTPVASSTSALGTYILGRKSAIASAGSTHSGSQIGYSGAGGIQSGNPSGTWRLHGRIHTNSPNENAVSVFHRIS